MSTQEGSQDSQFIKQQIKDFPLSSKDAMDLIARLLYLLQAMNDRMDRIDSNIQALNQRIARLDREMVKTEDHLNTRINRLQAEVAQLP